MHFAVPTLDFSGSVTVVLPAILLLFVTAGWKYSSSRSSHGPRPPGPKPLPIIGNLLDIPRVNAWKTFTDWSELYGLSAARDVVHLRVLGRSIVVLNSAEAISDLFEGRFGIYSDRPSFPLADMIGHQWNFGFMPYGKEWRSLRRLFSTKYSTSSSMHMFYGSHRTAVSDYLKNILQAPTDIFDHNRLRAGQLIMDVTYGISVKSPCDRLIQIADAVMDVVSVALSPSMWLVNPIAIVQSLPGWLGGPTALPGLQRWRSDLEALRREPFEQTKKSLALGTAKISYAATLLQETSPATGSKEEAAIRDTAALAYGAGFETTVTAGEVFLLAMVLYPDVQKKAHEELDRVVGTDRLPDFSDRSQLPYISAIMKEVFRWHPPAPTGIPHQLRQNDVYKGHHIPAGSIIMGNIWGILHNPKKYPSPREFRPERFMVNGTFDCSTNDPSRFTFGFGRRICPGRLFAEDSSWLMIAQFLTAFEVLLPEGAEPPRVEFRTGGIPRPLPFKCAIRPRSQMAVDLVQCAAN
ncbi:cytochrome P450 [Daedaleopsis nitida]|nr:cytochrome P450 [Daedaleopsis nitida]